MKKILFIFVLLTGLLGCKSIKAPPPYFQKEYENAILMDNKLGVIRLEKLDAAFGSFNYECHAYLSGEINEFNHTIFAYQMKCITPSGLVCSQGVSGPLHNSPPLFYIIGDFESYVIPAEIKGDHICETITLSIYSDHAESNLVFYGEYLLHFREDNPIEVVKEEFYE